MMDLCSILEINVNDLLSGEKVVIEQYIDKADENLIKLQKQKEIGISSARWTHITTIIIFLIWNAINVIKYGITQAIDMPEFIVMNIITLTYFIIYIFLLRRIERK